MNRINRCGLLYTDKVVIITGGAKGIGSGCARVFVDASAKVMIGDRDSETGQKLASKLSGKGPGACAFECCDVARPNELRELIDATVERFGQLDCLINNVGFHPPQKKIDDFT